MNDRADLTSRADIERLVDAFYDRVQADDRLGPMFNDVAQVDWAEHLPKMYAFWGAILFGEAGFKGDPMTIHRGLARRAPMTRVEFDRWVELFHATVDELFEGPVAYEAKQRAARIAMVMQHHITMDEMAARL